MVAWRIFIHSLQMIFNNLPQVVRIVLVPMGIGIGLMILFAVLGVSMDGTDVEGATGAQIAGLIFLVIALIGLALWVIVAWHRFILLAEYPQGWVPVLRTDRMLSYFGRSLILGLVMMGLILPLAIVMGLLGSGGSLIAMMFMVLFFVALNIVLFRLSVILPAAAIGQPLTLREAWNATQGSSVTILILVLILGVAHFVVQPVVDLLIFVPLIGLVLMALGTALSALVNISILTTLYGYYIEKRAL